MENLLNTAYGTDRAVIAHRVQNLAAIIPQLSSARTVNRKLRVITAFRTGIVLDLMRRF